MWRRIVVLVVINLAVFAVLAEAAALGLYYWDTGRLFYAHRPVHAAIPETARGELTADVLHPYFGPIHRPGVRPETNNVGFGSPRAFPFVRTSARQWLVGIFGGSVARNFCDLGTPRLAERLARQAAFADREIVPLCFSHEGYKQPQQLLVLAYFLSIGQELDLAINIDGFNEVALGIYNHERGRDISMPSPLHLDPLINLIDPSTMTPSMLESLAAIDGYKRRLNDVARRIDRTLSAAVGVVLDRYYIFTRNRYILELGRLANLPQNRTGTSLILVTPPGKPRDSGTVADDIAAGWTAASLLMHDMLAARAIGYLHLLQPNQYFTDRRFGDDEARVAINPGTPFKRTVEAGYPALIRASAVLKARTHFVDATAVFDREAAAVYADDCCHYTPLGNERLAELIASEIGNRAE